MCAKPSEFEIILGYKLISLIAEGGMGLVYKARQLGIDGFSKLVAIKFIRKEFSVVREFRRNFSGEAKLVADLIHTNIVQTYHLGSYKSQYFIVMEYVNGVTLEDFIFQHVAIKEEIPVDIAVFIVSRICRGLAYAHTKTNYLGQKLGIVHRDVNPRNIMLAYEGDVKLTDFGIAKARKLMYNKEGDVIAGKDDYLSPEQAQMQVTDARADLFCCGILLAELLMGTNLFSDETPEKTRLNVLQMPIPDFSKERSDVDSRLNMILQRSLQRDRELRYQSAYEMLTDLELYLYSDGYGPTNEKLGEYLRELFKDGKAWMSEDAIKEGSTHA